VPQPIANSSARRIAGVSAPASDSTASAAAASSISSCVARINRLRSARSPSAPAGTASSSTWMLAAVEIALTSRADVVNESITHCAATVCIHEPMLLTNCADHSLLKLGSRIGAQPDSARFALNERHPLQIVSRLATRYQDDSRAPPRKSPTSSGAWPTERHGSAQPRG
jgi:hypothetical protein